MNIPLRVYKADYILTKCIKLLFLIVSLCTIIICVFFQSNDYVYKTARATNYLLLPTGIVILFTLLLINHRFVLQKCKSLSIAVSICLIIFLLQVLCVSKYYFHAGWDVHYIELLVDDCINNSLPSADLNYYFSIYPNNIFMAVIYSLVQKIIIRIGFWEGYAFFGTICFVLMLSQCTALLQYLIILKTFTESSYAMISLILFEILIGMSPWLSIPYSDQLALLIPTLSVYLFQLHPKNHFFSAIKYFILGFILCFSYSIKPQASIVSIAIIIYELYFLVTRKDCLSATHTILIALGMAIALLIVSLGIKSTKIDINENLSFGFAHFMMMGMNRETDGAYSLEDNDLSVSIDNTKMRTKVNLEKTLERIREMGFCGFINHISKKILSDYNDGAFAWWKEGPFVFNYMPEDSTSLCYFLRNLYYNDGKYNNIWLNFTQIFWMPVLFFSVFAVFPQKDIQPTYIIIYLTILGVFLFNILFETRARYLFVNIPLFIIVSIKGLNNVVDCLKYYWTNKRELLYSYKMLIK